MFLPKVIIPSESHTGPCLMQCIGRLTIACIFIKKSEVLMSTKLLWKCLLLFYRMCSYFLCICWHGLLTVKNKKRLQGIVRVCSKIAYVALNDQSRSVKKAQLILSDPSYPPNSEFMLLPSGRRYSLPRCRTNRKKKNSFVPAVIGFLNKCI